MYLIVNIRVVILSEQSESKDLHTKICNAANSACGAGKILRYRTAKILRLAIHYGMIATGNHWYF